MIDSKKSIMGSYKQSQGFAIKIVESLEGFFALQTEWESLRMHCHPSSIFQSWVWNWTWWKYLAPTESRLRIVTCRDAKGKLRGLAPLYLYTYRIASKPFLSQLRFIGTDPYVLTGEYLDIFVHPADSEAEIGALIAKTIIYSIQWDSIWLALFIPESAVSRFFASALQAIPVSRTSSPSYRIDVSGGWREYLARRGRRTRKKLNRTLTELQQRQDECFREITDINEQGLALDALVAFHQARWVGKGWPGTFSIPGFQSFLGAMVEECNRRGQLRIWAIFQENSIAAVMVAFIENGNASAFQMGFDSRYEKDSLGFVLVGLCIRACFEDMEIRCFDLMSGGTAFKTLWTREEQMRFIYSGYKKNWRTALFYSIENTYAVFRAILRSLLPGFVVLWGRVFLLRLRKTR
jgi:CelD/BcsL family acetyltransferase involved in cellulose biosynthesis